MAFIDWKQEYELGVATMDNTHREYITWLNTLDDASDDDFLKELDGFVAHTQAHFDQEERWMRNSMFPAADCHGGMHAEILKIIVFVRGRVASGEFQLGRDLVRELGPWFDDHAEGMDTALAKWINGIGYNTETGESAVPREKLEAALGKKPKAEEKESACCSSESGSSCSGH